MRVLEQDTKDIIGELESASSHFTAYYTPTKEVEPGPPFVLDSGCTTVVIRNIFVIRIVTRARVTIDVAHSRFLGDVLAFQGAPATHIIASDRAGGTVRKTVAQSTHPKTMTVATTTTTSMTTTTTMTMT